MWTDIHGEANIRTVANLLCKLAKDKLESILMLWLVMWSSAQIL
jgi:hypothetical protein